jgi:hypothetical protein
MLDILKRNKRIKIKITIIMKRVGKTISYRYRVVKLWSRKSFGAEKAFLSA